jgi:hypothetical protein
MSGKYGPACAALLVLGCALAEEAPQGPRAAAAKPAPDQGELAATTLAKGAARRAPPALQLAWLEGVKVAEDGRGALVATERALAFDVVSAPSASARSFQLHVGDLVLTRSEYPRPRVLRFLLAHGAGLSEGARVTLARVGQTERIVLAATVEVPR